MFLPIPSIQQNNPESHLADEEGASDKEDDNQPPEAPPRQRRTKKANVGQACTSLNPNGTVSMMNPRSQTLVNGLPPTPKVHMGACFSKVFNECPLKIYCAASWVHPDTHDQHILLGKFRQISLSLEK